MRVRETNADRTFTVNAVAGSHVVILGMNFKSKKQTKDFRGFAIERTDHTEGEAPKFLVNFKKFKSQQDKESSFDNPIQEFVWGDYTAKEDHQYTYRVIACYGQPGSMRDGAEVSVDVRTENAAASTHAVYFNRGVGGSQAYATRYKNLPPDKARAALKAGKLTTKQDPFDWLSRGLFEGLKAFIAQANGQTFGLRASLYEFRYDPVAEAFAAAAASGADVKIVFDAKDNGSKPGAKKPKKAFPRLDNLATIAKAKIENLVIPREQAKSAISHNKFIVLLQNGKPVQVWTGSTNISEGGIFGHSNVGHLVRDAKTAADYLRYWEQIAKDPTSKVFRPFNDSGFPVPVKYADTPVFASVFSPRGSLLALDSYAKRMDKAKRSIFLTAAFGVSKQLSAVLNKPRKYLRYVLLEKPDDNTTELMKRDPNNRFAVGSLIKDNALEGWVREKLTGLNDNVKFVHTKYMLIDPLSDDPTVIAGSANFSKPSTDTNDENMLVIRGDTRVADIYLGEFMRLFNHYEFRQRRLPIKSSEKAAKTFKKPSKFLDETDGWSERFWKKGSPRMKERLLFA